MPALLVVYDSGQGHTEKLAEAIAEGAGSVDGCDAVLKKASEATDTDLRAADGILLGCPTHMGGVSAGMQQFIDTVISGVWMRGGLPGKVGAVFTASGSPHGGQAMALLGLMMPLFSLGMTLVSLPPMRIRENAKFGYTFGVGAATSMQPVSKKPDADELALARALGKRVAEVAVQLAAK